MEMENRGRGNRGNRGNSILEEVLAQNRELSRTRSSLEEISNEYMDLYNFSPVGYVTLDAGEDKIVKANFTFLKFIGMVGKIEGSYFTDFILPEDQTIYYQHRKRFDVEKKCELRLKRKNAPYLWVSVDCLKIESGVYHVAISDLTEAKQAEELKTRFLATLNHELRNPLNAIIGMTDLTLLTELTEQQRTYLGYVASSSAAMLEMVSSLLEHSKIEAGKENEFQSTRFRPSTILLRVCAIFTNLLKSKPDIKFTFKIDPDIDRLTVVGDPLKFTQILNNLLGNALKFTERGEIYLKVDIESVTETKIINNVMLVANITDTGIGLTEPQLKKLFKPFVQIDDSLTRKYGGTGLGLCISRSICEKMGGSLEGYSGGEGKGSNFQFKVNFTRCHCNGVI